MSITTLAENLAATLHNAKAKAYALQDIEAFAEALRERGFAVSLGEGPRPGQANLICDLDSLTLPKLPAPVEDAPKGDPVPGTLQVNTDPILPEAIRAAAERQLDARAEPAPETPAPKPEGVKRWTDEEDARLFDLREQGWSLAQIGDELGRTEKAVMLRSSKLNLKAKKRAKPAPTSAPAPEVQADPGPIVAETIGAVQAPEPDAPEVEPATIPPAPLVNSTQPAPCAADDQGLWALHLPTLTSAEQRAEFRLRSIGYPDPFTPRTDVYLVVALAKGEMLSDAAECAGLTKELARARWKALLPEVTLDGQNALISVLRKRDDKWTDAQL